ncbi:hypothetical protein HDF16_002747 [Granulicella aggregans]|uniref:Uncharacterized protein n=1 Tax=Granulicella aggregans TaxID=474949 RepID=A0A7W7ZDR4_9BACT|nr:hypothetical protein [Granulicella aggregans]
MYGPTPQNPSKSRRAINPCHTSLNTRYDHAAKPSRERTYLVREKDADQDHGSGVTTRGSLSVYEAPIIKTATIAVGMFMACASSHSFGALKGDCPERFSIRRPSYAQYLHIDKL